MNAATNNEPWGKHHCHAVECEVEVPPEKLMCYRHWKLVPRPIQVLIWKHYRPGQEITKTPTTEYLAVMKQAIEAVAQKEGKSVRHNAKLCGGGTEK